MKQQTLSFLSFIFLFNCIISSPVGAQKPDKALEKKINVNGQQIRIDSLLRIFSRQTTLEFSFNSKKISPAKKVGVPKRSITVFQWLQNLRQQVNIDYKLVGNHLVLLDRTAKVKTVKTATVYAGTSTGKRNTSVLSGNKIHNSKMQNNYSVAHTGVLQKTTEKYNVVQKETAKNDPDTLTVIPMSQVEKITSIKENISNNKIFLNDTIQTQAVKNAGRDISPVKTSSSLDTIPSWDYKHQLTLTPGKPIYESGKYYGFSIGLDYDRKLLSFGKTVSKNNTAWKRFGLNLEVGVDYVFDKDSTRFGGFFIGHLFPDLIYKLGQYAHIDLGAGLAVQIPSPAAHLGYGVNVSVNFPVTRQKVVNGSRNAFNTIILFGAGFEMYEFWPFDPLSFGTLRLTMLFPGKKR